MNHIGEDEWTVIVDGKKIFIQPILFFQYMWPNGGLTNDRETHALFYFYLLSRKNFEEQNDMIVYEGDPDPQFDYKQLYVSIAKMYNVRPENMANCWKEVDYTCFVHNLPKLPEQSRLRQCFRPEVILLS